MAVHLKSASDAAGTSRLAQGTVLFVAAMGAFLAFLDVTVVNIAFPSIRASFPGTSISELSWVLNVYNIVLAAAMVVFGRLADLFGRRRLYIAGLTLFVAASVLCAVAGSVPWLLVARGLQALGAAMLVPASLALVVEAFPAARRAHAVGLWGASAAAAAGLGPPIGGALVEWGNWRWAFLVNVPFGLLAIVAARRGLVESRSPGRRKVPDLRGALALAVALALLTTAITTGNDWGWTSIGVLLCVVGAVVATAAFVASSRVHPSPLVDRDLLRVRGFVVANTASTIAGMGFYAYLLTNVLWLQYVWGYDVLTSGLALVPAALVAAVVAGVLGPLAQSHGYRLVVIPGAILWAAAYVWYALEVGVEPRFVSEWLPGQVLSGIGVGATLPILGSASLASVPGGGYATASAVNASLRQLGGVLGIAALVAIIGTPGPGEAVEAFRHGWLFAAACFAACAMVSLALGGRHEGEATGADDLLATAGRGLMITVPEPGADGAGDEVSTGTVGQADSLLSRLGPEARADLEASSERVLLAAGDVLFRAGDPADAAYTVVTGRLEVSVAGRSLRLLGPGAVLGELALLTDSDRSATVKARRDSVLLRLRPRALREVMDNAPGAGRAVATVLAGQLAHPAVPVRGQSGSRTVAVVGLHRGAPSREVAEGIRSCLVPHLAVELTGPLDDESLARAERTNPCVLLVAEDPGTDPEWWARAVRQADQVVAVCSGDRRPEQPRPELPPGPDLVLVGPGPTGKDRSGWARATDAWQVTAVDNLVPGALRPLADRITGRSLGLVLAGGGARALAHVGLLAALEEAGIVVDRIAGCSIGGVLAGLHASGRSAAEMREIVYAEFVRRKPFSDYTVPRVSLAKGDRQRAALLRSFGETTIEELPAQFRCVSTDLLAREVVVHRRGSVVDALMATSALPGLFPPVQLDGRLLVDGGVLANLPTGALLERDEGPVIAANVGMGGSAESGGATRNDRALRTPSLGETLLRTMLIGSGGAAAGALAAGATVVTLPSMGAGLLEFHQFDLLYDAGLLAGRRLVAAREGAPAPTADG
ncbi:MDR family MFS transporter/patatin-like phospholipase family protein [Nocardioides sp. Root140]|uniref:MDR family MFS transporter/patatin-like phospholipase family protein n=1 Tax=Nocardioides sp. Root140 TaxID=1736460 RepID=UPI000AE45382|nr:MDR family MFS transporter/patatin-like phospholipase family protein [Nocardioides sp. Root140]